MPRLDRLLVATVGVQWLATAAVALTASHSGSLWGDPAAAGSTIDAARDLASGSLPSAAGPLYPLLLAPLVRLTSSPQTVSSVVTTINVIVLAPLAAYCVLGIARRVAGDIFALAAAATWSLGPLVAARFFTPQYHGTFVGDVLPAVYGLTVDPAYLAMALSLLAALLALEAVAGTERAGFAAGLAAAAAIACLPLAAGVAAGAVLALLAARRWHGLAEAAAGLAAGLLPTLVWRHRAVDATITLGDPTWIGFQNTMANVREYFASNRVLQWLPVAGAIGLFRLARPAAVLIAGWVAAATVIGVATEPSFDRGRALIDLIPAWPAYALLVAAIPALVPTLVRRLGDRAAGVDGGVRIPAAVVPVGLGLALLVTVLVVLVG